jgi:hypothetical protein
LAQAGRIDTESAATGGAALATCLHLLVVGIAYRFNFAFATLWLARIATTALIRTSFG